MFKFFKIAFFSLALLSFSKLSVRDELKSTLKKAKGFYDNATTLYMSTTIQGKPTKKGAALVKIGTAELYRDKYKFYTKALNYEMYCDGKKAFVINHGNKSVVVYLNFDVKRYMKENTVPVDSAMNHISSYDSIVKITSSDPSYRVYTNADPETYTEFVFDNSAHYLKTFNYTINLFGFESKSDFSKILVTYHTVSKKLPRKINFETSQFLDGIGNKVKLKAGLFKGYSFKSRKYYYDYEQK